MTRHLVLWPLMLGLLAPSGATAQRFSVSPMVGYRIGGNFPDALFTAFADTTVSQLKLANGFSFGGILDIRLTEFVQAELLLDHQQSELKSKASSATDSIPEIGMGVNYLHAGLFFEKPGDLAPFFAFGLGVSYLNPESTFDAETRFSGGFSLGAIKTISDRIGARFEGRLVSTHLGKTDQGFCRQSDCFVWENTTLITQVGLTAALRVTL
jgi:Outer membrane protein beta-barrel domain